LYDFRDREEASTTPAEACLGLVLNDEHEKIMKSSSLI
jgi:hypothetical protein